MPNDDPLDGFFYPTLTFVIDSYITLISRKFLEIYIMDRTVLTFSPQVMTLLSALVTSHVLS